MKKSEKILLIISGGLTVVGAVSIFFAWISSFLLAIGVSLGFCVLISHFLNRRKSGYMPWWMILMFILSFLPVILCFYWSIDAGINGTGSGMIFPRIYGWKAFSETIIITSFLFTVFPVFPIAIIIQVKFIKCIISIRKVRNSERS